VICQAEQRTPESNGIILKNEYVTYRISADGRNLGFLCNRTGKQYCAQPGERPVVTLKKGGVEYQPASCDYAGGRISIEFPKAGVTVVVKVATKNHYFVFEVESVSDPQVEELRLVDLAVTPSKYVSVMSGVATDATLTLAAALDENATNMLTEEQPDELDSVWGYGSHGNVIRIDEELIQYSGLSREPPYGFTGCKRGVFGTKPARHEKGTAAGHLFVRWGCFHPDENSTLVDDIADAIAHAFDTCGFDMIYMDGVTETVHGGWHGAAKIRRTIYQKIKRRALVEASCWDYHSWPFHSRLGAWDHPKHGLKRFIDLHCRLWEPDIDGRTTERYLQSTFLPTQLGWWVIFGPTRDHRGELPDEIEYLCSKALGHDSPISFQGIQADEPPRNARRDDYLAMVGRYERLRLANYFSEAVKARLRQEGEEFRLVESSKDVWRFVPTDYSVHKVTGGDDGSRTWKFRNRFAAQPLKLRIEALYSVEPYESDDAVVLADFSNEDEFSNRSAASGITHRLSPSQELVKIGEQSGYYWAESNTNSRRGAWAKVGKTFVPEADIEHCDALGVWIHGDGLNLYFNNLPAHDSVTCFLSPIKALPTKKVTLRNPAVEISGRRITFPVALESGAYLEFESESDCRLYDERGALIRRIQPRGERPLLASGENQVHFTCKGPEGCRARANVTVISHGEPFGGETE